MSFKFQVTNFQAPKPGSKPTPQSKEDPYRRKCESEPGYDWRTDPYYSEDAIRERLKATKAQNERITQQARRSH